MKVSLKNIRPLVDGEVELVAENPKDQDLLKRLCEYGFTASYGNNGRGKVALVRLELQAKDVRFGQTVAIQKERVFGNTRHCPNCMDPMEPSGMVFRCCSCGHESQDSLLRSLPQSLFQTVH